MKSVQPLRTIVLLCIFTSISDCQTTPFDIYAEVSVPNQPPSLADNVQKIYTTKINVEKKEGFTFVQNAFAAAAGNFYGGALTGFVVVDNVRNTDISSSAIEVIYDVKYAYPLLNSSINGDDSAIINAIGNMEAVRLGLNEQGTIISNYPVLLNAEAFSFSGSSICGSAACNGTYVSCVEVTDGVNVTCVSNCKTDYCGDDGICFHSDVNQIPTCRCTSLPDLWVIGQRCETKFPLWLVVLLAVIGFLILLLVIIIVIVCVRKKRRRRKKKQELLAATPKSFQNNGFVNDEIRTPTVPTVVPTRPNPASSLARDDSFETVTSSEIPPSEYRPRSHADRRSHAGSTAPSSHHHHHPGHGNRHHHRHRRHGSDEDSTRRRDRSRERPREQVEHLQRPPSSAHSTSSESDNEVKDDQKNLSYYEVEVNDLDLETDAASSVVATSSTKSSPIRWLPPKTEQPRPGWVPSLGPLMYDLPGSKKTNSDPKQRGGGTDV